MDETSKRRLRAVGYAALLLTTGMILGPVAVAAIGSLSPGKGESDNSTEAAKLVEAYDSRSGPETFGGLSSTQMPPNGQECGYKDTDLFGGEYIREWAGSVRKSHYTPYEGYDIILTWRERASSANYKENLGMWIDEHVPAFEIAFLRRCIEYTAFSGLCLARVASFAANPALRRTADYARGEAVHGDEILCTFIDGIAARKGLPLPPLKARNPNWSWGDGAPQ